MRQRWLTVLDYNQEIWWRILVQTMEPVSVFKQQGMRVERVDPATDIAERAIKMGLRQLLISLIMIWR